MAKMLLNSVIEPVLIRGQEELESDLLLEIKKINKVLDKQPKQLSGEPFIEVGRFVHDRELGGVGGNPYQAMILVSAGDYYPPNVVVSKRHRSPSQAEKARKMFGSLPPIIPGLHEEAAADLMATVSTALKSSAGSVVQLLVDVPFLQRSKEYYLKKIEIFLKNCNTSVVEVQYMGNSEKDTGNWCFKDGTISFQEIFDIYRKFCPDKCLMIVTDCSYCGKWVRECAKTLDCLLIPPCGHSAKENGAMIKVFASCQPDQEATEPCFSIEAVSLEENGSVIVSAKEMTNKQRSIWFDSTQLTCCGSPEYATTNPCTFTNSRFIQLTWENTVDKSLNVYLVRKQEENMWYFLLLSKIGDDYSEKFENRDCNQPLDNWGVILEHGEGVNPPQSVENKVLYSMCITA